MEDILPIISGLQKRAITEVFKNIFAKATWKVKFSASSQSGKKVLHDNSTVAFQYS